MKGLIDDLLEPGCNDFQAPVFSSQRQDENVTRVVWFFDDYSCFLEATLDVDPLDGGETMMGWQCLQLSAASFIAENSNY